MTRTELEARATELGIKFQPNTKDATLEKKIAENATSGDGDPTTEENNEFTKVRVVGPAQGRWRIGMQFTREGKTIDVTEDELIALNADPDLVVIENPDA